MTWLNTKVEPGIGALKLMIPMEFFDAVKIRPPYMHTDPGTGIDELLHALETFADLLSGCQGWLFDRSVEYHAAILMVAHNELPKRDVMAPFDCWWVTKREDGTWFLQKEEERMKGGLRFT